MENLDANNTQLTVDNVYMHCQLGVVFKPYEADLTWNIKTSPFISTTALQNLAVTGTPVVIILTEVHAKMGSHIGTKNV